MGTTTAGAFASNQAWIPYHSLTQVFRDVVELPNENGWITMEFDSPVHYSAARNVVVAVHKLRMPGTQGNNSRFFQTATTGNNRTIGNRHGNKRF